jgi:hypothetical protein
MPETGAVGGDTGRRNRRFFLLLLIFTYFCRRW